MTSPATAASAAIAAAYLQQLQQLQKDAAEAAGILLPPVFGPSDKQIRSMAGGAEFMPWPLHKPEVNVPFFGNGMYKYVNLNAATSQLPSGIDLPINDITTLRFFFNLGVQQSRAVLLFQQFDLMRNATADLQSEPQSRAIMDATRVMSRYAASYSSSPPCISTSSIPLDPFHQTAALEQTGFLPMASGDPLVNPHETPIVRHYDPLIFPSPIVSVSSSTSSTTVSVPFTSSQTHITGHQHFQLMATHAAAAEEASFPDSPFRQRINIPSRMPNHFALAAAAVAAKRKRISLITALTKLTPFMAKRQTSPAAAYRSSQGGTPPRLVEQQEEEDTPALAPMMILSYLNSCFGRAKRSQPARGEYK